MGGHLRYSDILQIRNRSCSEDNVYTRDTWLGASAFMAHTEETIEEAVPGFLLNCSVHIRQTVGSRI
jgi:hypothetical protein